jgi:beta-1,2-mannobiose phosphorylase / 1,2-beta-oligomannan phosphorylase
MFTRHPHNPLITPADVKSSRPDFEVIGTFNAGATHYHDETLLLLRVAERPVLIGNDTVVCPYLSLDGEMVFKPIRRDDSLYDLSDPRTAVNKQTGELFLTSISHLRLARSHDGIHFEVDSNPWLAGEPPYETFGIEDARITCIEDRYYVNYTAVSENGIATGLVSTPDFVNITRHGVIFVPSNRDVTLFPQQINGHYVCYHRPMPGMFGSMSIWMATSPDLIHWGNHRLVLQKPTDGWESGRVGGGAPPIWTEKGWLSVYHAADRRDRYCLGLFLCAHEAPDRIIARSKTPILEPQTPYELSGFFGNVVFTCGTVLDERVLRVYYGASDDRTALAEADLDEVLRSLI